MALAEEDIALPTLLGDWTPQRLLVAARMCGFVRRRRKKDVWVLVWVLVLGFSVGARRCLTGLHHSYSCYAEELVTFGAFQKWFSAELVALLKQLVFSLIEQQHASLKVPEHLLGRFAEVIALDSSVVNLHRFLAGRYPATNKGKAAAKLHAVINVFDSTVKKVIFTGQRTADLTVHRRLGPWVAGRLLLFDLGYFHHSLFKRIDDNGGFFVCRLKRSANPLIVADNHKGAGRRRQLAGHKLRDVLDGLHRDIIDLTVEVNVKKRVYRGRRRTEAWQVRLLGQRRPDGSYFLYYTNVPAEDLGGDDICAVYTLRWQVELLFACLKGHLRLHHLPSRRREVVEALMWAAILSHLVSRRLFRWVRLQVPAQRHMPSRRFAHLFARIAAELLELVLHPQPHRWHRLQRQLIREAPDPNKRRRDRSLQAIPLPDELRHREHRRVRDNAA